MFCIRVYTAYATLYPVYSGEELNKPSWPVALSCWLQLIRGHATWPAYISA